MLTCVYNSPELNGHKVPTFIYQSEPLAIIYHCIESRNQTQIKTSRVNKIEIKIWKVKIKFKLIRTDSPTKAIVIINVLIHMKENTPVLKRHLLIEIEKTITLFQCD